MIDQVTLAELGRLHSTLQTVESAMVEMKMYWASRGISKPVQQAMSGLETARQAVVEEIEVVYRKALSTMPMRGRVI